MLPVPAAVVAVDKVMWVASTMEATVVPAAMPVPTTGSPTNMPTLLSTVALVLPLATVVSWEVEAGAVKDTVGPAPVGLAESVTRPVA